MRSIRMLTSWTKKIFRAADDLIGEEGKFYYLWIVATRANPGRLSKQLIGAWTHCSEARRNMLVSALYSDKTHSAKYKTTTTPGGGWAQLESAHWMCWGGVAL